MRDTTVVVVSKTAAFIDNVMHALAAGGFGQVLLTSLFVVDRHGDLIITHRLAVVLGLAWVVLPSQLVASMTNALRCPLLTKRLAIAVAANARHDGLHEAKRSCNQAQNGKIMHFVEFLSL